VLLDEQLVVYDKVVEAAKDGVKGRKKVALSCEAGLAQGNRSLHELARRSFRDGPKRTLRDGSRAFHLHYSGNRRHPWGCASALLQQLYRRGREM